MVHSQEQMRSATYVALQRLVGAKDPVTCLDGFFAGKDAVATQNGVEELCRIVKQGSLDRTIEVLIYLIELGAESQPGFIEALKAVVRRECAGTSALPNRPDDKKTLLERVLRLAEARFLPLLREELAAGLATNVLRPGAWENLFEEFAWTGAWKMEDPNNPDIRANTFRWSCGLEALQQAKLSCFGLAAALHTIAKPQDDHRTHYRLAQAHSQAIPLDRAVLHRYAWMCGRIDLRKVAPNTRTTEDLMIGLFGSEYKDHPTYKASHRSEGEEQFAVDETGALRLVGPDHMCLAVNLLAEGRWGDTQRVVSVFMPAEYTKAVRTRSIGPLVIPAMYQAMREQRWGVAAALGQIAVDPWTHDDPWVQDKRTYSILSLTVRDYVTEAFRQRFADLKSRIASATYVIPASDGMGGYATHQPDPPPVPQALIDEEVRLEQERQTMITHLTVSIRQTVHDLLSRVIELGIPLQLEIF